MAVKVLVFLLSLGLARLPWGSELQNSKFARSGVMEKNFQESETLH